MKLLKNEENVMEKVRIESKEKKVFLLVGSSDWGKTETLKNSFFAGRNLHIVIDGVKLKIRTRSNCDVEKEFNDAIDKFKNEKYLILAFSSSKHKPEKYLNKLKSYGFKFYAFVLESKYRNPQEIIPKDEIDMLKQYGVVEVYNKKVEANVRAADFKEFIRKNLP